MIKKTVTTLLLLLCLNLYAEEVVTLKDGSKIVIYNNNTWAEYKEKTLSEDEVIEKNRQYLRKGIPANKKEIREACEMYEQGWTYTMPIPKSKKAAWGITDGRTTWYYGYWYNTKTGKYSDTTPKKSSNGLYIGDNQNSANKWRNGGTPGRPTIIMYLLSESGGPQQ